MSVVDLVRERPIENEIEGADQIFLRKFVVFEYLDDGAAGGCQGGRSRQLERMPGRQRGAARGAVRTPIRKLAQRHRFDRGRGEEFRFVDPDGLDQHPPCFGRPIESRTQVPLHLVYTAGKGRRTGEHRFTQRIR